MLILSHFKHSSRPKCQGQNELQVLIVICKAQFTNIVIHLKTLGLLLINTMTFKSWYRLAVFRRFTVHRGGSQRLQRRLRQKYSRVCTTFNTSIYQIYLDRFDLPANDCGETFHHTPPIKNTNTTTVVQFKRVLMNTITISAYMKIDELFEIDQQRVFRRLTRR